MFDGRPENDNLQIHRTGNGLMTKCCGCSPNNQMDAGVHALHRDLHPTQYEHRVPEGIRLILPTRGILPMGSSKGVIGYGMIHPNTINAAVLHHYGVEQNTAPFDAMSLLPNFDLLLTNGQAELVARQIVGWTLGGDHCSAQ